MLKITFELEGSDKGAAFFALYAGLRMYKEQREKRVSEPGAISISAAEAYGMMEQLKERFPCWYKDAEEEFNKVYINL